MAPKPDTWMPLYIGDYLADTMHLSTEAHGAYLLLIMAYWTRGPLADDNHFLAGVTRLPLPRWRKLRPIVAEFFEIEGGHWRHKRIDKELTRAQEITDKRRRAGQASAAARAKQNPNKRSTHVATHAQQVNQQRSRPSPTPSQDSVSDTENNPIDRECDSGGADAQPNGYAFVGRIVRLKQCDFDRWRKAYPAIPDIRAEIQAADDYYAESPPKGGKWFFPVSNWLKKANAEAAAKDKEDRRGEDWW